MADILVVDDDVVLARSIASFMERRGLSASYAADAKTATVMAERQRPRLIILDIRLGRDTGLDLLSWFHTQTPEAQIVVMTGRNDIGIAADAMKRGARDFLTKPAPLATIATVASNLMLQDARQNGEAQGADRILGRSAAAVDLRSTVRRLAPLTDAAAPSALLVTGPRGAGKASVARAVFEAARGDRGPLAEADCSLGGPALDAALGQSGGTVLLRHIDALTQSMQSRLMQRFASHDAPWVLATTSGNLAGLEREGTFRADLLYRIQVGWIDVPPLADRSSDILPIAEVFARRSAQRHGRDRPRLSAEARVKLVQHDWPRNLSELENCIERAVLLAGNAAIGPDHIQILARDQDLEVPNLIAFEAVALSKALAATRGNITRAASLLGISRDTLRYRIEKHDISRSHS